MIEMNLDRKALHKAEYLNYSVDELAVLTEQMARDPARYTPGARDALKEALIERNLDAGTLLRNLRADEFKDAQVTLAKEQRKQARSKTFTRRSGRVIGSLGIPMSIVVGGLSIAQAHFGGLAASVAWLGCSIWMAFYYEGD
jgi:hypothetical protein